jgi:hypothetical protein
MKSKPLAIVLKTFDHTRFHPGCRLFTWHPRGEFNDARADEIVGVIESEELFHEAPFYRYTDLSQLTNIRLKIGHVFQIAERRREVCLPVKSAIFADTTVGLGIARMYESLMEGAPIQVRAFTERTAAAQWLSVPVDILQPG